MTASEPPVPVPTKLSPVSNQHLSDNQSVKPVKKVEPKAENFSTSNRTADDTRQVAPTGAIEPISLNENRRSDVQQYAAQLEKRLTRPKSHGNRPVHSATPHKTPDGEKAESSAEATILKAKPVSTTTSAASQMQAAQAAEKAADAENAKAAAKEANLRQASTTSAALQQGVAQQQNETDKSRNQSEPESKSLRKVDDKSENTGGAAKSGRGTESEQARRQMQQQQRTQQNSNKASQQGSSSNKTRYITKPQEPENADDIATSDETAMKSCEKCGYALGGSADLACPVCSTEQPDLALRLFTQYRQMGTHWITFADTLAVTDGAREALNEREAAPVQLQFVPRIPKFSQVLRLKQQP